MLGSRTDRAEGRFRSGNAAIQAPQAMWQDCAELSGVFLRLFDVCRGDSSEKNRPPWRTGCTGRGSDAPDRSAPRAGRRGSRAACSCRCGHDRQCCSSYASRVWNRRAAPRTAETGGYAGRRPSTSGVDSPPAPRWPPAWATLEPLPEPVPSRLVNVATRLGRATGAGCGGALPLVGRGWRWRRPQATHAHDA